MKTRTGFLLRFGTVGIMLLVVMASGISPAVTSIVRAQGGIAGSFEANGKSLYIQCLGTGGAGAPTIVLETGEGAAGQAMKNLQLKLAERTMTCAYDRANTGSSSSAPKPRTGQNVIEDLHALLAAANVPGPYVLVGHSAGGMFVQLYARKYADQVAGVVAMNPVPPAHPWLDEVSKIFTPEEYADEQGYYHGQNGESFDYLTASDQLAAAPPPPNVPFEMFISTIAQCDSPTDVCGKSYSTYERILKEVTAAWPRGHFSQIEAGHDIYQENVDAVVAVVERVLPPGQTPSQPQSVSPGMPPTGGGVGLADTMLRLGIVLALLLVLTGSVLSRRGTRRMRHSARR